MRALVQALLSDRVGGGGTAIGQSAQGQEYLALGHLMQDAPYVRQAAAAAEIMKPRRKRHRSGLANRDGRPIGTAVSLGAM